MLREDSIDSGLQMKKLQILRCLCNRQSKTMTEILGPVPPTTALMVKKNKYKSYFILLHELIEEKLIYKVKKGELEIYRISTAGCQYLYDSLGEIYETSPYLYANNTLVEVDDYLIAY